jgi:hypothetical protein
MPIEDLIIKEIPPFDMPVEGERLESFPWPLARIIPSTGMRPTRREADLGDVPPTFKTTKSFWWQGWSVVSEFAGLDPQFRIHGEEEY